jgi:hypothetical protein
MFISVDDFNKQKEAKKISPKKLEMKILEIPDKFFLFELNESI